MARGHSQAQDAEDALGGDALVRIAGQVHDPDVGAEAASRLDEDRRGTRVQPRWVADLDHRLSHAALRSARCAPQRGAGRLRWLAAPIRARRRQTAKPRVPASHATPATIPTSNAVMPPCGQATERPMRNTPSAPPNTS